MANNGLVAQVDGVAKLEQRAASKRLRIARKLQTTREKLGLSLSDVAPSAGIGKSQLSNIERGTSWHTPTVRKVAEVLDQKSAA